MPDALLVSSSFLPGHGGIESYLAELCAELSPRLAVLARGEREGKPLPHDLGYQTIAGPGSMLVPSRKVRDAIVAAAQQQDTERVLFGTPWPLSLLGPALRRKGLRYAVIVHGAELLVPSAIPLLRRKLARSLAEAEVLLPISEFTATKIRKLLGDSDLEVPEMGILRARVDVNRFSPAARDKSLWTRYEIDPDEKVIVCFGRLVKRKGVDRMIAALDEVSDRAGPVALVVAGTGPEERRLRKLASNVRSRVVFAGRVSDEEAPSVYASADVFALPVVDRYFGLDTEGLGVVLLEAAACGLPCVTGASGGTPEAIVDGHTGFVIDARDQGTLTDRVAALLTDPDLARRMGEAGRRHVQEHFGSDLGRKPLAEWLSSSRSIESPGNTS